MRFIVFFSLMMAAIVGGEVCAQGTLIGKVVVEENGVEEPLYGANVWWEGTEEGTVTLEDGTFEIPYVKGSEILVVSFVGYKRVRQPIEGKPNKIPPIKMEEGNLLDAVEVREVIKATSLSSKSVGLSYEINKKELRKAACCNVAESFETNPAVDVSFSDAITGAKRIEMLGLSGKYAPVQIENIPFGRGLAVNTSMTFLPGPWVESIHLSKGTGSVVNGFESTTGLIDVELTGPAAEESTHLNAYINQGGRNELNVVNVKHHNDYLKSAHLLHYSSVPFRWDVNRNGFMDMPMSLQLNGISRWQYDRGNWHAQLGIHYVFNRNQSGQMDYDFNEGRRGDNLELWGMQIDNQRISAFSKTAYLFDGKRESSIALIANAYTHEQEAFFGNRVLNGYHDGVYGSLLYQNGSSSKNKWIYKTGLSIQAERMETQLGRFDVPAENIGPFQPSTIIARNENVVGGFGETQYKPNETFDAVLGLRADYSDFFDVAFFTPRLHLRYAPEESWIIRAHAGSARRSPLPLMENITAFGSSRSITWGAPTDVSQLTDEQFSIDQLQLQQEIAWNFGLSLQKEFRLFYRKGSVVIDGFYTHFENQLVTDYDHSQMLRLYYGNGGFSRGAMLQVDYEVWRRFEARVAYKYLDVQQPYAETGLRENTLIPPHRWFLNLEYETRSKWAFDLTVNWFGSQRIPDTQMSPETFQLDDRSPNFFLLNGQVRKDLSNQLTVFLGVENILNVRQENPIQNFSNPYQDHFDATMVWGPIFGRMTYLRVDYTF